MKTKLTLISLTVLMLFAGLFCADAQPWKWSEQNLSYAREGLSATTLDDSIFFSGGRLYNFSYKNTVDVYDIGEDEWETVDLESQDRFYTTSVSCNGKVFIAGGINLSGNINCPEVDIFDKETGEWTVEELSEGRHFIGAVANGNKVYFAGGLHYNGSFIYYDVIDVYDTETEAWSTMFLTEPHAGLGAATAGGKLFFAGGATNPYTFTALVEIYDINTGVWTYTDLSEARAFPATVAYGNKVYFAGGMLSNSLSSDVVDIYNVDTETWEEPQTLSGPRIARALKVKDALVFAGETDYISSSGIYGAPNGTIDIYYPELGLWDFTQPDLDPARIMYGCTSYDNKAYFGGGYPGGGSLSDDVSILEYDTLWVGLSESPFQHKGFSVLPNPFTTNIQIDYTLAHTAEVSISIYNNMGTLVETLLDHFEPKGVHKVFFDGSNLPVGIYYCVLKTGEGIVTEKIVKL